MAMTNHSNYRNSNEPMSIDSTELKDIEASATSLRKPVAEILETLRKVQESKMGGNHGFWLEKGQTCMWNTYTKRTNYEMTIKFLNCNNSRFGFPVLPEVSAR